MIISNRTEVRKIEKNIYQKARDISGYTQERAAELLDLSVESIRAYETDKTLPNPHTVMQMVQIYGVQHLSYQHLEKMDKCKTLPKLILRSLEGASLNYRKESRDIDELWNKYEDIVHDGVITIDEVPPAERFLKELKEEVAAATSMIYAVENAIKKAREEE